MMRPVEIDRNGLGVLEHDECVRLLISTEMVSGRRIATGVPTWQRERA